MKLVVLYAGAEDSGQAWPDSRSLALQNLAGSNVLGHVLNQLRDAPATELVLIIDRDAEAITSWLAEQMPGLPANVIQAAPGASTLQALAAVRGSFGSEPLIVAPGSCIVEAEYKNLAQSTADVTIFTKPQPGDQDPGAGDTEWAGVCYFRRGADLRAALDDAPQSGRSSLALLLADLGNRALTIEKRPATLALDAGTIDGLLFANARLLGLGYGSEDAIERSYVEDFTVIPPVFLHETAVIENAVVGPFTNVEARARISSSVVRNSLIGHESTVENVVLDGSLIGSRATVKASGAALTVEEDHEVALE